jgi:alpha-L-fucosidase
MAWTTPAENQMWLIELVPQEVEVHVTILRVSSSKRSSWILALIALLTTTLLLFLSAACEHTNVGTDGSVNDASVMDAGDAGMADAAATDAGDSDMADAAATDAGDSDMADAAATDAGDSDMADAGDAASPPVVLTPQERLSAFADMRYGMFLHFNMGTFTDEEWASPNRDPMTFAPSAVDTEQWATVAQAAKMRFGILTTKHHDGFCLWDCAGTDYDVMSSGYRHDIVQMYVDSFRSRGLNVGLYFSVWDRTEGVQVYGNHHGGAGDQADYITRAHVDYTLEQVRELLTNYGQIDLFITDGYGWQAGQQAVPYQRIRELVHELQPNCVVIDHGGLSVPFIGDAIYFEEPLGIVSPVSNTYASCQGQTISNGWFWHPNTPTDTPMSLSSILTHLSDLEPRYTNFILNTPPNRNGQLDANIVNRLNEVAAMWNPNAGRAPLPTQPLRVEHPITPRSAYATDGRVQEPASNAIDGWSDKDRETCWSNWPGNAGFPQSITFDLGGLYSNVSTLEYLPKQWGRTNTTDGDITGYAISTSTDGVTFTQQASGTWPANRDVKLAEWDGTNAAYVRITVSAASGNYSNLCGLRVGGRTATPVLMGQTDLFPISGYFKLINRANRLALDGRGGGVTSGDFAGQWTWNASQNLQWQIEDVGGGYYKIINRVNGLALDGGDNVASGANATVQTSSSSMSQHWAIERIGWGFYRLTNRVNGFVLDSDNAAQGAAVRQRAWPAPNENEMWLIELVP